MYHLINKYKLMLEAKCTKNMFLIKLIMLLELVDVKKLLGI